MKTDIENIIKNYEELVSKGEKKVRADALKIVEGGIKRAIPYQTTMDLIKLGESSLQVGDKCFINDKINHIYVVGAGKGSFPIAAALNNILGDRITQGVVVVKEGETRRLPNIEVFESSHPIPDKRSIEGANKILEILNKAEEGDIVFAAITGGSSALVNLPKENITIKELQDINNALLKCGAPIGKINAVRKHICGIKGGRLVSYAQPAAVITLTLDTSPEDMPWPDMCLPDPTTFQDAINVLKFYGLWDITAKSIREYLIKGKSHPELETLKSLENTNHHLFNVASPQAACEAAAQTAEDLGYTPYIISTDIEGEAKDLGIFFAGMTNEIVKKNRPFTRPCALISGGETTVTISDQCGLGGPNQETVLGLAAKLKVDHSLAFVSIDTDGTDGPSNIAGGIVDSQTKKRAGEKGIDLNLYLKNHDSANALQQLEDEIITGHTGTNVMNLRVVVIE